MRDRSPHPGSSIAAKKNARVSLTRTDLEATFRARQDQVRSSLTVSVRLLSRSCAGDITRHRQEPRGLVLRCLCGIMAYCCVRSWSAIAFRTRRQHAEIIPGFCDPSVPLGHTRDTLYISGQGMGQIKHNAQTQTTLRRWLLPQRDIRQCIDPI